MEGKKNFAAVLILLAVSLAYAGLMSVVPKRDPGFGTNSLGAGLRELGMEEESLQDFEEVLLNPDSYVYLRHCCVEGDLPAYVFVGYFGQQRIGSQVHSPLNCLPGSGWNVLDATQIAVPGLRFKVRRVLAERAGEYGQVYYWFVTPARVTCSEFTLKLELLKSGLLMGRKDAFFVRVSVSGKGEQDSGELYDFLVRLNRALQDSLTADGWSVALVEG